MKSELHIRIHPDVSGTPDDILAGFPLETGQSVVAFYGGMLVVDLAEADDTTTVQEWYLNSSEDVLSFYIVSDDATEEE